MHDLLYALTTFAINESLPVDDDGVHEAAGSNSRATPATCEIMGDFRGASDSTAQGLLGGAPSTPHEGQRGASATTTV